MATAEGDQGRWRAAGLIAVPIIAALAVSWWALRGTGGGARATTEPLAVQASSAWHFEGLAELSGASDLVVVATVVATERGRLVGDPRTGAVISRRVTLEVQRVLHSRDGRRSTTVVVEEEGWLEDGTPIIVNGLAASAPGDHGVWFLDEVATDGAATYIVINEQGRYLQAAGRAGTVGAQISDPLIERLQAMTLEELAELVAGRAN